MTASFAVAGNIDPDGQGERYALSDSVGVLDFAEVTVQDTHLEGVIRSEAIGDICLLSTESPHHLRNDGQGNLGGYAYSPGVGWICFEHSFGQVTIDEEGYFHGWAWSQAIGWIPLERTGDQPCRIRTSWRAPGAVTFSRGEVNNDRQIDIADAVAMLFELFLDAGKVTCYDAGDTNDDGTFDASDTVYLLSYLFLRGASPPAPFGACGPDPTDDATDCASFPGCE